MTSPADLGWGDPRSLTGADMTGAQLWPGHVVQVRNDDVAVVMMALVRRLRAAGWPGPDPLLDESGYAPRLKRWAEAKYRAQGLTEPEWLRIAPLSEWSDHAWGTAVDLDTSANPMLATRPANPQASTTFPVAACPGIAASLGLAWGGSWAEPWDPQHFQVAVTPQRLAAIAEPIRRELMTWADASHYQTLDLVAYFVSHDRIALKVTEGTSYVDPTFADRYRWCVAHQVPVVLYHFDRAKFSGAAQFDWFESRIRAAGGPRPWPMDCLCLDSEDTDTPGRAAAAATEFTGRAVARGYQQGSVYTGLWFARPYGITANVLQPGWRRLWLSDYNPAHTDATMPLPPGWTRAQVMARQYSSTATVAGISGACDASRTVNDWLPRYQEDDDMPMTEADSVLFWGHDVRTDAGVQPAWRMLSDAQLQAVAARDAANAAKTAATQAVTLAQQNATALADLTAKVAVVSSGGSVDPAAVAAALDLDALAAAIAAHIQLRAV